MAFRLFIVSFNARTGMPEQDGEVFVKAENIPDAFLRFRDHKLTVWEEPTGIREAGPVAQNVFRKLMDKRSIL